MEQAAQLGMPFVLLLFLKKINEDRLIIIVKILLSLTFLGHGLYALGVYPVPGHFVFMCEKLLDFSDQASKQFLFFIGLLDAIAALAIWFKPFQKIAVIYMLIWFFLTSLARPAANLYELLSYQSLLKWTYETLIRFPHWILPLCLLKLFNLNFRSSIR